jgi:hypothetical protein
MQPHYRNPPPQIATWALMIVVGGVSSIAVLLGLGVWFFVRAIS